MQLHKRIAIRKVREGGLIFIPKCSRFIGKEYAGKTVELWEALNGLEIRYKGEICDIIEDYWDKIK